MPSIARSPEVIPQPLFQKILNLHTIQPWTTKKKTQLDELLSLCSSAAEFELVLDLLTRFRFLTGDDFELNCEKVSNQIVHGWKLTADNTVIIAKHFQNGRADSSAVINQMMVPALVKLGAEWTRRNFENRATVALERQDVKNLVLVDDFSGTGKSAADFIAWAETKIEENKLGKRDIYLAFFCAMEQTKQLLKDHNRLFVGEWLKRGISDHYPPKDAEAKIAEMIDIEKHLDDLPRNCSLGFGKSESLYAAQNLNIPNNTFPIFWWPSARGAKRAMLFARAKM